MRTTVTIPDDIASETMRLSKTKQLTKAIVNSLRDYLALKKRLALIDLLFDSPMSHNYKSIKNKRRANKWSS